MFGSLNNAKGIDVADKAYLSEQNGTVIEKITFADYTHYAKFNDRNFFVGTIEEALQTGYQFKVALESLEEEGKIPDYFLSDISDTDERARYEYDDG